MAPYSARCEVCWQSRHCRAPKAQMLKICGTIFYCREICLHSGHVHSTKGTDTRRCGTIFFSPRGAPAQQTRADYQGHGHYKSVAPDSMCHEVRLHSDARRVPRAQRLKVHGTIFQLSRGMPAPRPHAGHQGHRHKSLWHHVPLAVKDACAADTRRVPRAQALNIHGTSFNLPRGTPAQRPRAEYQGHRH